MHETQENFPVLSAAELLTYRWCQSGPPGVPPPETVILCYQPGLMKHFRHKHAVKRIHGFLGELHLVKASAGRMAVAGGFGIGAPAAVIQLEELAAFGVRRFISLGLAGSLQPEGAPGDWLICSGAARDEGTSSHYLPSGLRIDADRELTGILEAGLAHWDVPLHTGPVWTTDAPFREGCRDVETWQREGLCAVDMESAALFVAGRALGVQTSAVLTLADRVSPAGWQPPSDAKLVHRRLIQLGDAVLYSLIHAEHSQ